MKGVRTLRAKFLRQILFFVYSAKSAKSLVQQPINTQGEKEKNFPTKIGSKPPYILIM